MHRLRAFLFAAIVLLLPAYLAAVDGVVLINQSTVMAAGGFPYTITQPGSYKLSGNLVAPAGVNGIVIAASNVTLDLNGFTVGGPAEPSCPFICSSTFGIKTQNTQTAITIRNGTILGFGGSIDLTSASHGLVEDLIFVPAAGGFISASVVGSSAVIHHVVASSTVVLVCPVVVAESLAPSFAQQGTGCIFTGSSGTVF